MDNILSFLADNYKWFMLAAVILLFALIGFIVDGKKKKKSGEVVPVPNADAQAQAAAGVAPTSVANPEPVTPAPAPTNEEQKLVIEEPSLNNVEATSNEVNIGGTDEGSIFGTPELQAPASVETTTEDPTVTDTPTLVIEDKEETAPEMNAPVQSEPTPVASPKVAPVTPEVVVSEAAPTMAPAEVTPAVVEPAPEMSPAAPETPVNVAPEVPSVPETPVVAAPEAPSTVATPVAPETPSTPTTPVQQ